MNIIAWILFGLITGAIANAVDPRPAKGGLLGAIILGVVGGLIGGYLGTLIFGVGVTGFNFSSIVVAVLGSLLVLIVGRVLSRA